MVNRTTGGLSRSTEVLGSKLGELDPEVASLLGSELDRQRHSLDMIASESHAPLAVMECQGSVLTNKYAEGYPGRRYYGGCVFVDELEQLAIDRAKAVFGGEHVNVQPHSGAQANAAAYHALLSPGDRVLGLELAHGGHLTHGMKLNLSGRLYDFVSYGVSPADDLIDMAEVERIAREQQPRLIVAGWSSYPRQLDFEAFRDIADQVGARLMVDMAHFAGLVAAGLHPSPVPCADVVTTTIHKTLGGARGGMIICREEFAKKIDSAVFPGQQGGPLEHVIAAKAVSLGVAAGDEFKDRIARTLEGAKIVAEAVAGSAPDTKVLTGGTDVHLVLLDLRESDLDGSTAESRLEQIGITSNRNVVPFDPRPPMKPSGLRLGTAALAARGFDKAAFRRLGEVISTALGPEFEQSRHELSEAVGVLADEFPLYPGLEG